MQEFQRLGKAQEKEKVKPILFNSEMVRAVLSGAKTQTRRVMKEQPPDEGFDVGFYHPTLIDRKGEEYPGDEVFGAFSKDGEWGIKSPFAPGITLWIRETFDYGVEGKRPVHGVIYRADGEFQYREEAQEKWPSNGKWKPSIFMPKWASRLTLEVSDVRIERVQAISEEDARAEGVECEAYDGTVPISGCYWDYERKMWSGAFPNGEEARGSFRTLWDSINGKRNGGKYSWDANPTVLAVTFKRVDNGR